MRFPQRREGEASKIPTPMQDLTNTYDQSLHYLQKVRVLSQHGIPSLPFQPPTHLNIHAPQHRVGQVHEITEVR